jgi:hypothetical protein
MLNRLNPFTRKTFTALTALIVLGAPAALAEQGDWSFDNLMRRPIVKQAAIGAAAGAAGGILSDRTSVGKGALVGGLAGVGTGAVSQSQYFRDKPLLKSTAQGAIVGTGAGYALGGSAVKGAVLGAGGGAGYHYIRQYLDDRR